MKDLLAVFIRKSSIHIISVDFSVIYFFCSRFVSETMMLFLHKLNRLARSRTTATRSLPSSVEMAGKVSRRE